MLIDRYDKNRIYIFSINDNLTSSKNIDWDK